MLVAYEFAERRNGSSGHQVMGDKGMAKIIDFGSFDACDSEVPVNRSPDISDQERPAGFGDKQGFTLRAVSPCFQIVFQRLFSSFVERDIAFCMPFLGGYVELNAFLILHREIGKFTDPDTGLEKKLNNGVNAHIAPACIAESPVFNFRQYPGRLDFVLGMLDFYGGIARYDTGGLLGKKKRFYLV